jgi:hypothetical protein
LPKAGTHLATRALDLFPGVRYSGVHLSIGALSEDLAAEVEPYMLLEATLDWASLRTILAKPKFGQYASGHLGASEQLFEILADLDYKVIAIQRDPRDVVVSASQYIKRLTRHGHHRRFVSQFSDDRERMRAVMTGFERDEFGPGLVPLRVRLEGMRKWLDTPLALCCRFEDLVGERGGGSATVQAAVIEAIGEHLDRPLTQKQIHDIAQRAWSTSSATFRAGEIGQWRERFDPELEEVFGREVGPEFLEIYGYE